MTTTTPEWPDTVHLERMILREAVHHPAQRNPTWLAQKYSAGNPKPILDAVARFYVEGWLKQRRSGANLVVTDTGCAEWERREVLAVITKEPGFSRTAYVRKLAHLFNLESVHDTMAHLLDTRKLAKTGRARGTRYWPTEPAPEQPEDLSANDPQPEPEPPAGQIEGDHQTTQAGAPPPEPYAPIVLDPQFAATLTDRWIEVLEMERAKVAAELATLDGQLQVLRLAKEATVDPAT